MYVASIPFITHCIISQPASQSVSNLAPKKIFLSVS